jgi:hypothetical protein
VAPAPKGSLVLGKSKGRLRTNLDPANTTMGMDQSNTMQLSREMSYDMIEGDAGHGRMASHQSIVRGLGEKGRVFAKSEELTATFHENLPLEVNKALGLDSLYNRSTARFRVANSHFPSQMHG